jgi:hypothetical protein
VGGRVLGVDGSGMSLGKSRPWWLGAAGGEPTGEVVRLGERRDGSGSPINQPYHVIVTKTTKAIEYMDMY